MKRLLLLVLALLAAPAQAVSVAQPGSSLRALGVDIQSGDQPLAWLSADGTANPLSEPLAWLALEQQQGGAGALTLRLLRGNQTIERTLPAAPWDWQLQPDEAQADPAWRALEAAAQAATQRDWAGVHTQINHAAALRPDAADTLRAYALRLLEADPDRQRGLQLAQQLEADVRSRRLGGLRGAQSALAVARAQLLLRDYAAAETAASLALERAGGPQTEHLLVAQLREVQGSIAYRRGDNASALAHYEAALALARRLAPESSLVAVLQGRIAAVALSRGEFAQADSLFASAIAQLERVAPDQIALGRLHYNAGLGAFERRRLAAAEAHIQAAVAQFERVAPGTPELAMARAQWAEVLSKRGEDARAEPMLRAALSQALANSPTAYETLSIRVQLAYSLRWLGQPGAAREQLAEVLALDDPNRTEAIFLDARALLGEIELDAGGAVAAAQAFATIIPGYRERHRLLPQSSALLGFGRAQLALGNHAAARTALDESLALRQRVAPDTTLEGEVHFARAQLARAQADRPAAMAEYRRAIECLERHRDYIGGGEEPRARWAARFAEFYREPALWLLQTGDASGAWELLERYRAREFLALLGERHEQLLDAAPQALRAEAQALSEDFLRAQRQAASGAAASVALPQARLAAYTQQLEAAAPQLAALTRTLPFERASAALPADSLLLSYMLGPRESWVLVGRPGAPAPLALPLGIGAADLAREIDAFQVLIARPDGGDEVRAAMVQRARRLHHYLIEPLAAELDGIEALLIIADGPLQPLPMGALVSALDDDQQPRYLAQSFALTQLASASAWLQQRSLPDSQATLAVAVLAASAYPAGAGDLRGNPPDLQDLPGARAEARSIAAMFGAAASLDLDQAATLQAAQRALAQATRTHFAGHALIDAADPLHSYLQLTPDQHDDGRLYAIDLMRGPNLRSSLVTLSACDSALGADLGGEGLVGLARAFQYAGVRSVVGTLWPVADRPTQQLMQAFYRELAGGLPADRALNAAQRELIAQPPSWWQRWWYQRPDHSHPYYWAGVVLLGSPSN